MRTMTEAALAAVTAQTVHLCLMTEADFDSGSINMFTGYGTLTVGGKDYLGTGKILQISPAQETAELTASNATFQLSGIQEADIAIALTENYNGRPGRMKLGLFDSSGVIITDPIQIYSGRMDTGTLNDDPAKPVYTMTSETDLIRLNLSLVRNYTHEDQQIDYSGDTFFSRVPAMQNKTVTW